MNKIKILLPEEVPASNHGEEAILRGLFNTIENYFDDFEFEIFSIDFEDDASKYGNFVKVIESSFSYQQNRIRYILNYIALLYWGILHSIFGERIIEYLRSLEKKAFLKANIILLGHDNYITGPNFSVQHILKTFIAKVTKKKLILCVGSFGPFKSGLMENLAKIFLQFMDLIILREPKSYEYCLSLMPGLKKKMFLGADAAWLLRPIEQNQIDIIFRKEGIRKDAPLVGITLANKSVVRDNFGVFSAVSESFHDELIARIVDYIVDNWMANVILLPHSTQMGNDDRFVNNNVYKLVKNKKQVFNIQTEYSAAELKGIMGELILLIAERTHSMIGALGMCTPVIGLSFPNDFRTYSILGDSLGLKDFLYDVRNISFDDFSSFINDKMGILSETRTYLETNIPEVIKVADKTGCIIRENLKI